MRRIIQLIVLIALCRGSQTARAQEFDIPESATAPDGGSQGSGGNADEPGGADDVQPDRPIAAPATGPGDPGPPVFTLDAHCSDMHACLKVRTVRGRICDSAKDSVALEVTNVCKKSVAAGICIEQADHAWDCRVDPKLPGKATNKKAFTTCHGTGAFHALATAAVDYSKQACFLNIHGPSVSNRAMAIPYLGVCARVKMCCRALQSLPGADSLSDACDALDALPDNVGVQACSEILNAMRRETGKVAGTPAVCH